MFDLKLIRQLYPWVTAALAMLMLICATPKLVQWNDDETYQIIEYPNGSFGVIDTAGWHPQWFGKVFTWPRYVDVHFKNEKEKEGQDSSIRVTFNDGGWGYVDNHLKFQMPVTAEKRIELQRHFGRGQAKEVTAAIAHHLMNCLKNTGPLMSASEHQAQRKSEFQQVVDEQLRKGLYIMERVKLEVDRGTEHPTTDDTETVYTTKIKRNKDGEPIIAAQSPLLVYGITINQYSPTKTEYDEETKKQIDAKRESYQLGEQAKAATLNEQQKLLAVIEKGKLAVAEIEAEEGKAKKKVLVTAEQEQDVAKLAQSEAVTKAEEGKGVTGEQYKKAKTDLQISLIKIEQATFEAAQLIAESESTKAKLEKGGAVSERDQVMAELDQRRKIAAAEFLSKIPAPRILILGGSKDAHAGNGGGDTTQTLMNLFMLQQIDKPAAAAK